MTDKYLSLNGVKRLLQTSTDTRVSDEAVDELKQRLERIGMDIARQAQVLANHAGRQTIKAEDVELAVELMREKKI